MRAPTRLAALVAALLTALAVVALSPASAAQLPLASRTLGTFVAARCTDGPLQATSGAVSGGASTQVVISAIPAACREKQASVRLYASSGAALAPTDAVVPLPADSATATLTVPSYQVAQASGLALTIGTWGVPTTWRAAAAPLPAFSCTVPAKPGLTCAATITKTNVWGDDFLRSVTITSTSTTPVPWELTINLSDPAFPFVARSLADQQGGLVLVGTSGCAATPRTVTVRGVPVVWGTYDLVSAGTPRELEVHGYRNNQPSAMLLNCP